MADLTTTIGGYFELEGIEAVSGNGGYRFHSGRAALSTLLCSNSFSAAAIPRFLCATVGEELRRAGIEVREYDLEPDMSASTALQPQPGEAVVLVNYFGVCRTAVDTALKRLPRQQCVVDNSQAFFEPPSDCLGTVYSPRKFFGLPDGGLLYTAARVQMPDARDTRSVDRCWHLLHRIGGEPEDGLDRYREAEASLSGAPAKQMSVLTERLLATVDTEPARRRRLRNFTAVHSLLGTANQWAFNEQPHGPLTYALKLQPEQGRALRKELISERIFSPSYWGELLSEPIYGETEQARELAASIVHIPIDQRYAAQALEQRLSAIAGVRDLIGS